MYLRFVVGTDAEDASRLTGIFTESRLLREDGRLFEHEVKELASFHDWFNRHLPCPPFHSKIRAGEWSRDAVSWFRPDAGEPLRRIWGVVAILREHGIPVRMIRADMPGAIVYRDPYQLVAETPRRSRR